MASNSTRKLYWADAYRRRFTAQVLERDEGDRPSVVLNRTLFYPTGGGQPHDTGWLGETRVLAVEQENGRIRHYLSQQPGPETELMGELDWPRRWDHMQQHSGQHLLSAAFLDLLQRPTIGFHLSPDSVTIDLPGNPPPATAIAEVIAFAQDAIHTNLPIRSYTVAPDRIAAIPLRKAPTVSGPVRVVEIQGLDWSACGGTHVCSTAAIGTIAITRLEKRGDDTRVYFICGGRAAADHRQRLAVTQALSEQLTTGLNELPGSVAHLQDDLSTSQKALHIAQSQLSEAQAKQLWSKANTHGGIRVIRHLLDDDDPKAMNRLLGHLLEHPRTIVLLGWPAERPRWIAGCSDDLSIDLNALLPAVRAIPGAQGGGRPNLVQGGATDVDSLEQILDTLYSLVLTILKESKIED